jgi:hypothetical protein
MRGRMDFEQARNDGRMATARDCRRRYAERVTPVIFRLPSRPLSLGNLRLALQRFQSKPRLLCVPEVCTEEIMSNEQTTRYVQRG